MIDLEAPPATPRRDEGRAGSALFHVALAAGVVPVIGLPIVVLAALSARRAGVGEKGRRWARRIAGVLAVDVLVSLVVIGIAAGALPSLEDAVEVGSSARIGIEVDEGYQGQGARVGSVLDGAPADDAGIHAGDVIVSVSGASVDGATELRAAIEAARSPVSIAVRRGSAVYEVSVEPVRGAQLASERCDEIGVEDLRPGLGTLLSYGVLIFGTVILALIEWRRGVQGGARVWAPFVTIPALGAIVGAGTAMLACDRGAHELVLESALLGSEIALVVLAGGAVWIASRGERAAVVTMDGEAPLSVLGTVAIGAFYVVAWVPRVLYVAAPLFAVARELGLEGASEALGEVLGGDRTPLALAMTFVAGAVLAPIGEELLFRGLLLPHLARIVAPWTAIAISALLFGALHEAHGVARIGPMAIGIILGWARLRSGTLRAPIALHMVINATALSVGWLSG